jgi:hypothetical protein
LLRALQLGLGLKLLLHQGVAVLGAVGEAAPPQTVVVSVAEALQARGMASLAGARLRSRLLGDAEPLGELTEAQAAPYASALVAYDEGSYSDAARAAEAAFATLVTAPPSTRCEALARQAQLLWGASLLRSQGTIGARPHFRWALERDPLLIADRDRFPPPVQRVFERERAALGAEAPAELVVSGVGGTSGALLVDGLPRGALPRDLSLPPHPARLWVEDAHSHGWAHRAALTADRPLAVRIDVLLESALMARDGDLLLDLPEAPSERAQTTRAVVAGAGVTDLVLIAKVKPAGGPVRLRATRFDARGTAIAETNFAAQGADYADVARALLAPVHELPVASSTTRVEKGAFPVLPVVLGAAGAVVLAAVLTAVFWPRGFELSLTTSGHK